MNEGSKQVHQPVTRREIGSDETVQANAGFWDAHAVEYQLEHGDQLGDADFLWGPEGLREADARLLGDVARMRVLEVGGGAAQCARWLQNQGARTVSFDLAAAQLREAQRIDGDRSLPVPLVQADAQRLPFRDQSFDVVCSAFGALPFVADSASVMREAARVLVPGGLWVFSTTHPLRWVFPDDPGAGGLVVRDSYFDRRPYVEQASDGTVTYAEHHRTVGDRVREIVAAGLELIDIVEPEWPVDAPDQWGGGWSAQRGRLIPGTVIFVTRRPRR